MNDKSITQDVSLDGTYSAEPGATITYKATIKNARGLLLQEPVIMMRIEYDGVTSPWVDAERVGLLAETKKKYLVERLDVNFIPNDSEVWAG